MRTFLFLLTTTPAFAQSNSDTAKFTSAIYMLLMLFLVSGTAIAIFKKDMGKAVQMALIWALIFTALTLGYGYFK